MTETFLVGVSNQVSVTDKLSNLPSQSGVYLLKDQQRKVIYVGKAKNLQERVKSYFSNKSNDRKIQTLVKSIADIEVILTANEIEALLLERTLIKHQKPKFNVLLRDDKEYPFLRVDLNEQWPRLEKVRRKQDDRASYFGPYGSVKHMRQLLTMVFRTLPLIRCSRHQFKTVKRPCNYYQMKMCLAPCHLSVDRDDYLTMVKQAMAILEGNTGKVTKTLTEAMNSASAEERFEEAARLRDQLTALRTSTQRQTVVLRGQLSADVFGISVHAQQALIYVLLIRDSLVLGSDYFKVSSLLEDRRQVLSEFLLQYYEHRLIPERLLLPFALEEVLFKALNAKKTQIIVPKRGQKLRLIKLAQNNAEFQLKYAEGDSTLELQAVQQLLKLTKLPNRIECLDISNLHNTAIVAAIVCFIAGKPAKKYYRRYKLAIVANKADDYASIRTVVTRRLQRQQRDGDHFDLLIIDGGKGQLRAAQQVVQQLAIDNVPIVALAKNRQQHQITGTVASGERLFVADQQSAIVLEPSNPAFRLLTHLRDEAHRFALAYHRQVRGKNFLG